MRAARLQLPRRWFAHTEVAMHRALQFRAGGLQPYSCTAGDRLVAVQPNGDLYPCRRMPIRVGNLMETPLRELYQHSDLFRALRDRGRLSRGCERCTYAKVCRGGLKCLSYAVTGDPFERDPGCWHAQSQQIPLRDVRGGHETRSKGECSELRRPRPRQRRCSGPPNGRDLASRG
jgi:radical SAM protein with 4Fe4S-binding SPASM domain